MRNKILAAKIRAKQIFSRFFFRLFPINQSKITIVNYVGAGYGDNAKYIVEELLKQKEKIKIVWALSDLKNKNDFPKEVKIVKYESLKFFYELYTSKIWIDNCRKHRDIKKRKKQFYIQLWHGDIGFKRSEADTEDALPKGYVKGAKNDAKMTDLMISGSKFFTNLCHRSFWYNGEVLESGCARNDIFFNKEACDAYYRKIRDYYKFKQTDKILLYAPTFRKDQTLKYYDIDFKQTLATLHKKFKGDWKILVRLHPNIAIKAKTMNIWNNNIINATDYPDAQELLIASDVVITDYSSIVFDFALLYRPIFLFAPDYELYNQDRGFHLDYFSLPFKAAQDTEKLQKNILNFSEEDYKIKLDNFLKNEVGSKETGRAAKIIAKRIVKEINETNRQ